MLNLVLARGWTDYDNFSSKLSLCIVKAQPHSKNELVAVVKSFSCPFFTLNKLERNKFIEILPVSEILGLLDRYVEISPITFQDVFPETNKVSVDEGKKLVAVLENVPESTIQEALVDSLREKNATNCRSRGKDTVLEVADLEHFSLNVKGTPRSFSTVVKGHNSVSGKTITWENIAHQILKAYNRTNPDYVLSCIGQESRRFRNI